MKKQKKKLPNECQLLRMSTIELFNYSTIECQLLRGSVLSDLFPEPRLSLKTFPLDDCIAYSVAMKDQIK